MEWGSCDLQWKLSLGRILCLHFYSKPDIVWAQTRSIITVVSLLGIDVVSADCVLALKWFGFLRRIWGFNSSSVTGMLHLLVAWQHIPFTLPTIFFLFAHLHLAHWQEHLCFLFDMFWYTSGKVVSKTLMHGDCWIAVLCMWQACLTWRCCEFLCLQYVMYMLHSSTFIIFENTSYENELLHCFIQNIYGASAPIVLFVKPCLCDIRFCGNLYGITYCHAVCCMA